MTDSSHPWSMPVMVAQIPENGLHQQLTATAEQRAAIAALGGLRDVIEATATFDLVPIHDGRVKVTGRLQAIVGQNCVVTLDPVDNRIDEAIDLVDVESILQHGCLSFGIDNGGYRMVAPASYQDSA